MTEIKISELLFAICLGFFMLCITQSLVDIYLRNDLRLSTKILIVITAVLLFGSLGYSIYDLVQGGVRFV